MKLNVFASYNPILCEDRNNLDKQHSMCKNTQQEEKQNLKVLKLKNLFLPSLNLSIYFPENRHAQFTSMEILYSLIDTIRAKTKNKKKPRV